MALQVKRCAKCGALGVGPGAVRLSPMAGRLWCDPHWKDALQWEEDRGFVVRGVASAEQLRLDARRPRRPARRAKQDWRGYIAELAGMAGWALEVGDRRTFVYYFARAVWAWGIREAQHEERS